MKENQLGYCSNLSKRSRERAAVKRKGVIKEEKLKSVKKPTKVKIRRAW